MEWKHVILGVVFFAMLAAVIRPSAFEQPVTVTETKTLPPKVVTKVVEKTVIRHVRDGKPPDGYMSRDDCFEIPEEMAINEVMYRYGWPAGRNGRAMGLGDADYPIREDHGATCHVSFPYGTVSSVTYHADHDDYEGTETWPDSN